MMIFPVNAAPPNFNACNAVLGDSSSDSGGSDFADMQILKEKMLGIDPVTFHFEAACDTGDFFFFDIKATTSGVGREDDEFDLLATEVPAAPATLTETAETAATAKAAGTAATTETAGTTPAADPRNPRKGAKQRCSICKGSGHKKRTCPILFLKN